LDSRNILPPKLTAKGPFILQKVIFIKSLVLLVFLKVLSRRRKKGEDELRLKYKAT